MNAGILDTITRVFVDALRTGTGALHQYALPLLGVFALIAFYLEFGPCVMSGVSSLGDALGSLLLTALKIGVFYWLIVNLEPLARALFLTFLQWGLAPTGGGVSAETFLNPSRILDLGFRAAFPLSAFVQKFSGLSAAYNMFTLAGFTIAYWIIIVAFAFVTLDLIVTIIEYHMAVLVAAVLLPFGILRPIAFFSEFAIGWLTGGLVRILVTIALIGIAVPLFDLLVFRTTTGGDPTFYSALIVACTSGIFAVLAFVIPARAAGIAGRGMALALHGGTIMAGAASGVRGIMTVASGVRGVSTMLRK
jgi:type IV secretion system protein TrbL